MPRLNCGQICFRIFKRLGKDLKKFKNRLLLNYLYCVAHSVYGLVKDRSVYKHREGSTDAFVRNSNLESQDCS